MAEQEYKKSRPLYIANYIRAKSDENHWVSQKEILDYLYEEFGIMPDRKTIKRILRCCVMKWVWILRNSHIMGIA